MEKAAAFISMVQSSTKALIEASCHPSN